MSDFFLICPCCDLMQANPEAVVCEECGTKLYPSEGVLETIRGEESRWKLYDRVKRKPRRAKPLTGRFVVGKVTGYAIPASGITNGHREKTIWYVYDRAYCYRALKKFHGPRAESRAYEFATSLNGAA